VTTDMTDGQEDIIAEPAHVTARREDVDGEPEGATEHPAEAPPTREEIEGRIMMEGVLPSFLTAIRAAAEGHPRAEELQTSLIAALEHNAKQAREGNGGADETEESVALWTAAVDLCRAVFIEHRSALDLVQHAQELDKHAGYPWKTLCVLCYLGGSIDERTLPLFAINLHMAVAEYVYTGTHQIPEVYEQVVAGWFCAYWERTFEKARFRFQAPRMVEMDLKAALRSDPPVRLQRVLSAMAFGLATSLPERGREWFQRAD
jgi:hypothetical protein